MKFDSIYQKGVAIICPIVPLRKIDLRDEIPTRERWFGPIYREGTALICPIEEYNENGNVVTVGEARVENGTYFEKYW